MKLAQALSQRADLKKRIDQLESRLIQNAKVQEGEAPAEEPAQLMKELQGALRQMEELISRINLTNAATRTADGTLTELLARRDCMMLEVGIGQAGIVKTFMRAVGFTNVCSVKDTGNVERVCIGVYKNESEEEQSE